MAKDFFNRDMQLFIDHRVDWERYLRLRGVEGSVADEVETYRSILRTTAEVCEDIEAGARDHWHEEVRLEDGRVVVPPYIAAGHEKLRQAGLVCLTLSPDYGGYGLPAVVNSAYLEMVARADPSLMTIIGLQSGVAADIEKYGTDELRQRYLPRFATGELQGAMDLTEPQAGSDLGGILARATQEGGRYFIDGEKIFITNGGAPIHLVLAREASTFEQSKGTTNGLNLMLCPVTLPDGTPNRVRVSRVEQKMGIHGSPTCVVEFDHAEAFLLGKAGQGFRAMLDLMNNARLGVAAQAVGVAEAACRAARAHAEQRVQFGAPIIEQPLVKSMLTLMVINIAAARALLYRTCALSDMTDALRRYLATERGAADPERAKLQEEFEHDSQHPVLHAALQVLRDRDQRPRDAPGHPDPRRHRLHGRDAGGALPRGLDHHDHLRGHLGDPGELRAEGDEQGRAVRHPRADAQRARGAPRAASRDGGPALRRHRLHHRLGAGAHGRPAVRAAERQAHERDGDRRGGGRGARLPGRSRRGEARAGAELHPPARAVGRVEHAAHRER
jgi:alkylation response protein AidB-like acyl-CoA dehydrogenase